MWPPASPTPSNSLRYPAAAARQRRPEKHPGKRKWSASQRSISSFGSVKPASAAFRHVLRGRTLLPFDDVELHRVTFGERLESVSGYRAVMHETVFLPVVRGDEAKALRIVEPFYLAGRTHSCSW